MRFRTCDDTPSAPTSAAASTRSPDCSATATRDPSQRETFDAAVGPQFDQIVRATGVEQRAVNVGAVRHRVGISETLTKAIAAGNVGDRLAGDCVHHQQPLDQQRVLLGGRADPERIEHRERVGRDLQADADLAEGARLLQHQRAKALARQRQRTGEPADAAAGNGDRQGVTGGCHGPFAWSWVGLFHASRVSSRVWDSPADVTECTLRH